MLIDYWPAARTGLLDVFCGLTQGAVLNRINSGEAHIFALGMKCKSNALLHQLWLMLQIFALAGINRITHERVASVNHGLTKLRVVQVVVRGLTGEAHTASRDVDAGKRRRDESKKQLLFPCQALTLIYRHLPRHPSPYRLHEQYEEDKQQQHVRDNE